MTGFANKIQQTWEQNILFSALLELTYQCNLDCHFCYNEKKLQGKPLSLSQYFELLTELRKLGTFYITLTGGEPLAHPDFFSIGGKARELGFVIKIKTNGHALHPQMVKRIKTELDPFQLEISLHGACAKTHDRQTRVSGSFVQLLVNLNHLKKAGMRFQLNTVLTRWNENEISAMFNLADELGCRLQVDTNVSPRDDGDSAPLALGSSESGLASFYHLLAQRSTATRHRSHNNAVAEERPQSKICGAGSSTLTIDPFGTVYPCVQWRRPVGSFHDHSITDLWTGSHELQQIRLDAQKALSIFEGKEDLKNYGTFCPGTAERVTHQANKIYPSVYFQAKIRSNAK